MKRTVLIALAVILSLVLIGEVVYVVRQNASGKQQNPVASTADRLDPSTGEQTVQTTTEGEDATTGLTEHTAQTTVPTETAKPAETTKPTETTKPAATTKPTEPSKPAPTTEPTEPAETTQPTETEPEETTKEPQNGGLGENDLPPRPL